MTFVGFADAARYAQRVQTWRRAQYDASGISDDPHHWLTQIMSDLEERAWTTGIESDRKQRGTSINVACTDSDDDRKLAIIQIRQCTFRPGRYSRVRKDYYLVGRNENSNPFAHPIDATARTNVTQALAKMWDCDQRDLIDIVRNGDVAFIPIRSLPALPEVEGSIIVADSHKVSGTLRIDWQSYNEVPAPEPRAIYVRRNATITHTRGQHPTAKVKAGWWRVQVAKRGSTYGFTAPTSD